jgi:hypothetical protein
LAEEQRRSKTEHFGEKNMLWTIFIILLVLWALGFGFHVGGLIHLLLVIAAIVLVIQLLSGRRAV